MEKQVLDRLQQSAEQTHGPDPICLFVLPNQQQALHVFPFRIGTHMRPLSCDCLHTHMKPTHTLTLDHDTAALATTGSPFLKYLRTNIIHSLIAVPL